MLKTQLVRACALLLVAGATPALAQDGFLSGVYLGSQALCDQAKAAGSLKSVMDEGNYVLSAQGLKTNDEDCQFMRVDKARGADAWLVSTLCLRADGNYPDLYAVSKAADGRVNVTSVYDGEEGNADVADDQSDAADGAPTDDGIAAPDAGADSAAADAPDPNAAAADTAGGATAQAGSTPALDGDGGAIETGSYVSCPGVAAP